MTNLKEDIVNELHKPARKYYQRRHVFMKGIDDHWQADLVELIQYEKENKNFKYLLTVIDCFSKFAFAVPVKDKTGNSVSNAMESIFIESNRKPNILQTDNGREFYCKPFQNLMKKYKIHHYSTYSHMKVIILRSLLFTELILPFFIRLQLWNVLTEH